MGSLLQIVSNHGLSFSNASQGINEMEKLFGKSIEPIRKRLYLELPTTTEINSTRYFYNVDFAEDNFNRYKEIMVFTNNIYCRQFTLKLRTIQFVTSCKFSYWRQMFHRTDQDVQFESQISRCEQIWPGILSFARGVAETLQGDTLIYFDGDRFQTAKDVSSDGGSIEDVYKDMSSISEPADLSSLEVDKKEDRVKGWYFELI